MALPFKLLMWRSAENRWKRAADRAMAPDRMDGERERLAAEVARRIWLLQGGREDVTTREEPTLLALEVATAPLLEDAHVQTSMAERHLQALEHNVLVGDYEDAAANRAEVRWVHSYLESSLGLGVKPAEFLPAAVASKIRETRHERLVQELARSILARLASSEIAAA